MPGENGIDIAKELRNSQCDTAIIFLTSTPEFAVESYDVQASNYLLKPVSQEKFNKSIDRLLTQLSQKENAGFIVYNSEKQYIRILFSQLIYAESMHKTVTLHLADNTKITSIMTFTEFLHLLDGQSNFIRPHRSYVVNMNYMQYVGKSDICLMNQEKLPLSRNQYKTISKIFLDYACAVSFQQ
jgi:DNA-binding LytR/AlgR family response regulator